MATTALALTGGLAAAPASAADKMSVGVGGYMQQWIGMVSVDDTANAAVEGGTAQQSDSEIFFKGRLEADNGLTFSVKVELEGDGGSGAIDESQATVRGAFGEVVLGSEDPAITITHHGVRDVGFGMLCGDMGKWINGIDECGPGGMGTAAHALGDRNNITYYTPRLNGVQFGATYVPNTGQEGRKADLNNNDMDAWSIGANYKGEMGGASIAVSAGHYQASQVGESMAYVTGAAPGAGVTDTRLSQYQHAAHKKAIAAYEGARDLMAVAPAKTVAVGMVENTHMAAANARNAIDAASAMMAKADSRTVSNFGLNVGFGAFSFDVAYLTQDSGKYKVAAMPMKMSQAQMDAYAAANNLTSAGGMVIDPSNMGDFTNDGVDNKAAESATNNDESNETWVVEQIVKDASMDNEVVAVGVMYSDGPMAVSLSHTMVEADDGTEQSGTMLSGSYTLAPGIVSRTSLIAAQKDRADGTSVEGAGFVTGITFSF